MVCQFLSCPVGLEALVILDQSLVLQSVSRHQYSCAGLGMGIAAVFQPIAKILFMWDPNAAEYICWGFMDVCMFSTFLQVASLRVRILFQCYLEIIYSRCKSCMSSGMSGIFGRCPKLMPVGSRTLQ